MLGDAVWSLTTEAHSQSVSTGIETVGSPIALGRNLFLQNQFVVGFFSGSQTPTKSISYTRWLTGLALSQNADTSTEIPLFPNHFA
jgi:hypothetical protein